MTFIFTVYYGIPGTYRHAGLKQNKKVRARTKKQATDKFNKKYPDLYIIDIK